MLDPELARKNLGWGIVLFCVFLVGFIGTALVALLYLALD